MLIEQFGLEQRFLGKSRIAKPLKNEKGLGRTPISQFPAP
jgi:hypothetical protein